MKNHRRRTILIDLAPAGRHGGELVAAGTPTDIDNPIRDGNTFPESFPFYHKETSRHGAERMLQ